MSALHVVSLVPSVTETLLAWGVDVVACSRFCEQPNLLAVGGTKDPDIAAIVGLAPDLVVMDEEENRKEDAAGLRGAGLTVHATAVRALADVEPALAGLAAAVGADPPHGAGLTQPVAPATTAFVPIWKRPWMTVNASTYASTLLAAVGVANVFAPHPDRYPTVTEAEIVAAGAATVLAPDEPYPFAERHRPVLERFAPEVRFLDGKDLLWWGVRTPAALARLGTLLGPPAGTG